MLSARSISTKTGPDVCRSQGSSCFVVLICTAKHRCAFRAGKERKCAGNVTSLCVFCTACDSWLLRMRVHACWHTSMHRAKGHHKRHTILAFLAHCMPVGWSLDNTLLLHASSDAMCYQLMCDQLTGLDFNWDRNTVRTVSVVLDVTLATQRPTNL